jgi:hypothetical protein
VAFAEDIAVIAALVTHIGDVPLKSKVFHCRGMKEVPRKLFLVAGAASRTASSGFFFLVA